MTLAVRNPGSRKVSWMLPAAGGALLLLVIVALSVASSTRFKVWWYMRQATPELPEMSDSANDAEVEATATGLAEQVNAAEHGLLALGPEARPHIERYLECEDWSKQRLAVSALVRMGDSRSMPALIAACRNEQIELRRAWLLGDIGDLSSMAKVPIDAAAISGVLEDALFRPHDAYLVIKAAGCVPLLDCADSAKAELAVRFLCQGPADPGCKRRAVLADTLLPCLRQPSGKEALAAAMRDSKSEDLRTLLAWVIKQL